MSPLYDVMDRIACAWLSVFSGIDLDVFRGFSSEEQLEDYFLNQQYHDNISVVAGKLSCDARKPFFGVSDQVRHKPVCIVTEKG